MTNRLNLWGLALLALSGTAIGCADHVKSAVVTCPCDRGICCTSGVCADDETACESATQALSKASQGHWTGYLENFKFASGSDALDLTLHVEDDGSLAGELIMGQGPAPAPPTDGMVGWPPPRTDDTNPWHIRVIDGFSYHLQNVQWTALRLRFDVNLSEAWGPWCRLQTPYDTTKVYGGSHVGIPIPFLCAPVTGGLLSTSGSCLQIFSADPYAEPTPVDCGWMSLCLTPTPCSCTADGCDAVDGPTVSFDIALDGDEGNGSVTYPSEDQLHNVRLIRASH